MTPPKRRPACSIRAAVATCFGSPLALGKARDESGCGVVAARWASNPLTRVRLPSPAPNEQCLRVPRTGADATNVVCRGSNPLAETMRVWRSGCASGCQPDYRGSTPRTRSSSMHGLPSGQAQSCNLCYVSSILTPCSTGLGSRSQWRDTSLASWHWPVRSRQGPPIRSRSSDGQSGSFRNCRPGVRSPPRSPGRCTVRRIDSRSSKSTSRVRIPDGAPSVLARSSVARISRSDREDERSNRSVPANGLIVMRDRNARWFPKPVIAGSNPVTITSSEGR